MLSIEEERTLAKERETNKKLFKKGEVK